MFWLCCIVIEILWQDEEVFCGFLIILGWVQIIYVDCDGNVVIVYVVGFGEVVGEVELLLGKICVVICIIIFNIMLLVFFEVLLKKYVFVDILLCNFVGILYSWLMCDNCL